MIDRRQILKASFYLREAYEQATVAHYSDNDASFSIFSEAAIQELSRAVKALGYKLVERDPGPADDSSIGLTRAAVEGR